MDILEIFDQIKSFAMPFFVYVQSYSRDLTSLSAISNSEYFTISLTGHKAHSAESGVFQECALFAGEE